jgi:peptidyl-tRNA hydrolase ICT1
VVSGTDARNKNVNKVNTKATLRVAVDAHWIPQWSRDQLRASVRWLLSFRAPLLTGPVQPQYAPNSNSILISSTLHRSQAQNIDDCLSKARPPALPPAAAALTRQRS